MLLDKSKCSYYTHNTCHTANTRVRATRATYVTRHTINPNIHVPRVTLINPDVLHATNVAQ